MIIKTPDIFCDSCNDWEHFGDLSDCVLRRKARKRGWTRKKENGKFVDLCPRCSAGDRIELDLLRKEKN